MKCNLKIINVIVILLIVLLISPASLMASQITIGEPASGGNCFPFGCSGGTRYQQVYNAALFSGPMAINELSFFNTQSGSGIIDTATYEIHFSTTSQPVNGLDTTVFNNNVGPNDQLFFLGTLGGPIGGTIFTISGTDFLYNPANGNLLLDIFKSNSQNNGDAYLDARNGTFGTDSSRAHNFGSGFESYGLVTRFSDEAQSVPEPGSILLLGIGLLGLAGFRKKN